MTYARYASDTDHNGDTIMADHDSLISFNGVNADLNERATWYND